jgi:hypothetical protein
MKRTLVVLGWLMAAAVAFQLIFVVGTHIYHSRRFRACSDELEAAVRAEKTFEEFVQDPRPDGLMRRYLPRERSELLGHIAWRAHTEKDLADADAMSKRSHTSAVFLFSDMVFVLFFDKDDRLREFVCLSN